MSEREDVMRQAAIILANRRIESAKTMEELTEYRYAPLRERWPDITEDELLGAEMLAATNLEFALKSILLAAGATPDEISELPSVLDRFVEDAEQKKE